jgi:hypothetical protein
LGFYLTTKLSFDLALEEVVGRAKGKVVEILRTLWNLGSTDIFLFVKLLDAQVKPMLLYASEIWVYTRWEVVETVHMFQCKRFLSVTTNTPNIIIYGDLGRFPLYVDGILSVIRYWFKIQYMTPCRLPKQAYTMLFNRISGLEGDANERQNWAFVVKDCFRQIWIFLCLDLWCFF